MVRMRDNKIIFFGFIDRGNEERDRERNVSELLPHIYLSMSPTRPTPPHQKHLRCTMEGPDSSYSLIEIFENHHQFVETKQKNMGSFKRKNREKILVSILASLCQKWGFSFHSMIEFC